MKRTFIILAFNTLLILAAQAQSAAKTSELQVYITGGLKFLQPKYFDHSANISPAYVPTIGSGVLWQVNKFQIGGEFNYTDGKKQTDQYGTIFTGINFNLVGGYNVNLNAKYKIAMQTGFGYSLHHLSLTDKSYNGSANLNTAIYHNFIYTIPVSVMLQRLNANGTYFGVRAGYHFNVMPNKWRYMEGPTTDIHTADTDGFYFQIVFGGMFKLKQ